MSLSLTASFQSSLKTRIKLHKIAYKMSKNCLRVGEGEAWRKFGGGGWGARHFCQRLCVNKISEILHIYLPEKVTEFMNSIHDICPKMPEFYIRPMFDRKIFCGILFVGWGEQGNAPLPSPTPMAGPQAPHQLNPALGDKTV